MMNHDLPRVKTVKLLFVAMDDQQQAMFKMAFKMHNTTNYQVISAGSGEKPELVIVDGDGPSGVAAWQKAKKDYVGSVVVYFSKSPPSVTAPYLAKPIKFDSLFLSLRNLLQGNGVWVVRSNMAVHNSPLSAASPVAQVPPQPARHHGSHQRLWFERRTRLRLVSRPRPVACPRRTAAENARSEPENRRSTTRFHHDHRPARHLHPHHGASAAATLGVSQPGRALYHWRR